MDSKRLMVPLILFMTVSALFAGVLYAQLSSSERGGKSGSHDAVDVAMVKRDLPAGTPITAELARDAFERRRWPKDMAPGGVLRDPQGAVGQVVRAALYAGEPLYEFKLATPGTSAALPIAITSGMRAITVPVDEVSGVGGFVSAGTSVDVIGTFRNVRESMFGHSKGETFSKVILEHVKVLASGAQLEQNEAGARADRDTAGSRSGRASLALRDKGTPASTTLLVTPAQSEVLALAVKEGSIHLALRNYEDDASGQTSGITKEELLGLSVLESEPPGRASVPAPPSGPAVEMIRGNERSSVTF